MPACCNCNLRIIRFYIYIQLYDACVLKGYKVTSSASLPYLAVHVLKWSYPDKMLGQLFTPWTKVNWWARVTRQQGQFPRSVCEKNIGHHGTAADVIEDL